MKATNTPRKPAKREELTSAMRLILVSGLVGIWQERGGCTCSKTPGSYCVGQHPRGLLTPFISHTLRNNEAQYSRAAVGVDARNAAAEIETVPPLIESSRRAASSAKSVFLLANDDELLRRFAENAPQAPHQH